RLTDDLLQHGQLFRSVGRQCAIDRLRQFGLESIAFLRAGVCEQLFQATSDPLRTPDLTSAVQPQQSAVAGSAIGEFEVLLERGGDFAASLQSGCIQPMKQSLVRRGRY